METLTNNGMSKELVNRSRQRHTQLNDQAGQSKFDFCIDNSKHRIERRNAVGDTTTQQPLLLRLGSHSTYLFCLCFAPTSSGAHPQARPQDLHYPNVL